MDERLYKKIQRDLRPDFFHICLELLGNGIFFEGQFNKPDSMYCKKYSSDMVEAFSKKTTLDIRSAYDTCYFVYYDADRYTYDEAIEALRNYHGL